MVNQRKMMRDSSSGMKLIPYNGRSMSKIHSPPCSWEDTMDSSFVFRDEKYSSASDALEAYIDGYETTLLDSGIRLEEYSLRSTIDIMENELLNLSANEANSSVLELLTGISPKNESPKRRSLPSPTTSPFYSPTEKLSRTPSPFSKLSISVPSSEKSPIKRLVLPDSPLQQVEDIVFDARIAGHATKLAPSWVEDLANTEITNGSVQGRTQAPSWVNELVNAKRKLDLDQYKQSNLVPAWVDDVEYNNVEYSPVSSKEGPGLTLNDLTAESPKQQCRSKMYEQKINYDQVKPKMLSLDEKDKVRRELTRIETRRGSKLHSNNFEDDEESSGFLTEETDTEILQVVAEHLERDRLANPKREESNLTLATDNTDYLLKQSPYPNPEDDLLNPERQISALTLATDDTDMLLSQSPFYEQNVTLSKVIRSAIQTKEYKPKGSISWSDQPQSRYVSRLPRKLASEIRFEELEALKSKQRIRHTARQIRSEVVEGSPDKSKLNTSGDSLSGDRSWEVNNPYKPPVPVPSSPEKKFGFKNTNFVKDFLRDCLVEKGFEGPVETCLSGSSHPGSMEALKNMLFSLQTFESKGNEDKSNNTDITLEQLQEYRRLAKMKNITPKKNILSEDQDFSQGSQSLRKAFGHLQNLRNLVSDNSTTPKSSAS